MNTKTLRKKEDAYKMSKVSLKLKELAVEL
jgi:hypothetical protein